MANIVFISL